MKQVLIQGGGVQVENVPAPQVSERSILVRVAYSCVSVGTESGSVRLSGMPLYRRALKQPHHVKRVLDMARDQGVKRTLERVRGELSAGSPTGYSVAGEVVEVGSHVEGFAPGDRVACAGAGIANHAEMVVVPVNLCVKIPDDCSLKAGASVTLGAIALQGIRRAAPTLGETVVVVGLGILGQLTVQMLKSNGCKVIGVDPDARRMDTALQGGADQVINPAEESYVDKVGHLSDGFGADAAIITAASESDEIVSQAMQACRKKARVILVGDVGLNLRRDDLYKKELDFLISTSYGPGRYDPVYEEGGQDYPLPYVRWTENRNMLAYLNLLATGRVDLSALEPVAYDVGEAPSAYEALKGEGHKPLLVLLRYPQCEAPVQRKVTLRRGPSSAGQIRVGLIGASGFAQAIHLPNMAKLQKSYRLRCVASRTGSNAVAVSKRYGANYATTDESEVLSDPEVDLVMIATRHNLHGDLVLRALEAGKHVFVEKPLAMTHEELDAIESFYTGRTDAPVLMTGFNRRFSPAMQAARQVLANRSTPMMISYRMNAGYIPPDHWIHGGEGGGRNIGEACHIYDLFAYLTGSPVADVQAGAVNPKSPHMHRNDNFATTITYEDGSLCTLMYTALGDSEHPKERMNIYCDGKVISMDDYKNLAISGTRSPWAGAKHSKKGQFEELQSLAHCLINGAEWPIGLNEQIETTRVSFMIEKLLAWTKETKETKVQ